MSGSAILALADGTVFKGQACGCRATVSGEVVFNTSMTGYQEILTDPSYAGQLVTLTCPHIGNCGTNADDCESQRIHARGLIVREAAVQPSNFRSQLSLQRCLEDGGCPGISGIDTRMLTRILRERGAQCGCLSTEPDMTAERAVEQARACPGLAGVDLARQVTTARPYPWTQGPWRSGHGYTPAPAPRFRVVAYDFGVKRNILRLLCAHGCEVMVVPATTPAAEVLEHCPDGVFLSNGPGDPEPCTYAITAITELLQQRLPLFGICLGHQLLALASGARTVKMKFGHHGANHPVRELATGRVLITSQNHGFAVDAATLPATLRPTHVSLFDGSLQGIERTDVPAFSFQGHPEASPGPHDAAGLFEHFAAMMAAARRSRGAPA